MNEESVVWDKSILPDVPLREAADQQKVKCPYSEETVLVLIKFAEDLLKKQDLGVLDDSYYDTEGTKEVFVVEVDNIKKTLSKYLGTYVAKDTDRNPVLVESSYELDTP